MERNDLTPQLQVQIVAFGQDGIDRVVSHKHPVMKEVRWLVSIQSGGKEITIPSILKERNDFDILVHDDHGVSRNRNYALDFQNEAPLVLLSDDDVDYEPEGLLRVIESFRLYPDADILCFRYTCNGRYYKPYRSSVFSLDKIPRGWYPSTIEMAFRRNSAPKVRFNELVGPGSDVIKIGEDTVWFNDMLRNGAKGYFIPEDICRHDQLSSGERLKTSYEFIFAHGAVMTHIYPLTWFPRLIVHGMRSRVNFVKYLSISLKGATYAIKEKIFTND